MTHEPPLIDEATLHAYVDGQLDTGRALAVADWLLHHPQVAQQVLAWREQREALQGLRQEWLDEPVSAHLLAAWQPPRAQASQPARAPLQTTGSPPWQRWPRPQAWAAGLALAVGLAVGVAGGWGGHAWWVAHGATQVPAFVRDAAIAHVVYQPEKRHPVEVGADQQDHLVQWLSKRLGQPLKVPSLDDQGFHLVGGRLLPSGEAKGVLARAQFMYEDAQGRRLTLYVSTGAASAEVPVGFRITQQAEGGQVTRSLYWIDGRLGYALNGAFDEARLRALAQRVHERLG